MVTSLPRLAPARRMPRVVVAGTGSGVGKTSVATGLMAALAGRGLRVAGFKVGPDYIDPSYHAVACGRPGRNLDAFLCGPELMAPLLLHGSAGADVAVVEGVMGLFDGRAGTAGEASTAQVATLLGAPVVLVVDASGVGRSIAAVVHGFTTFDPAVRVAGLIANRVGSQRHAELVREALLPLGIPLLGVLPRDPGVRTPSRHLGLVPAGERAADARTTVDALGRWVAAGVDLEAVLTLARTAPPLAAVPWSPRRRVGVAPAPNDDEPAGPAPVVAVAGGPAFTFAYAENLELLAAAGAEVVTFDPLRDVALPERTDAIVLGGGFPETHAEALSANAPLRAEIAARGAAGTPVIAECGGLLYLGRTLDGHAQCGLLPVDAALSERLHLGYRIATAATGTPWWPVGATARAHEFHHAVLTATAERRTAGRPRKPAWLIHPRRTRAAGDGQAEGFVVGNVHASWLHTHWAATPEVATRFVAAAREQRSRLAGAR